MTVPYDQTDLHDGASNVDIKYLIIACLVFCRIIKFIILINIINFNSLACDPRLATLDLSPSTCDPPLVTLDLRLAILDPRLATLELDPRLATFDF